MTEISVIICTYNRADYLTKLLDSLSSQTLSEKLFEILLVDNNSSDKTESIGKNYQLKVPNFRYIFEPKQGLSVARNRGLRESRSPLVAYIDDDAYASPHWLASVLQAFQKDNQIVCVGGPVELDWQGEKPRWIPKKYESLYTCVDHGSEERYLENNTYLVGANMAFRREWLKDQGGFRVELGRKGKCLISGEESHVYHRVFETGKKVYYHPIAKIWHLVSPERKTWKWFFRRLFWDGATQPMLDLGVGQNRRLYLRGAYHDIRRCGRFFFEALFAIMCFDLEAFADAIARLDQRLGRCYMHLRLAL